VGFRHVSSNKYRNTTLRVHSGAPDDKVAGLDHTQQPQYHYNQDNNHQDGDDSTYSSAHALTSPGTFPNYAYKSYVLTRTRAVMTTTIIKKADGSPPRLPLPAYDLL
jgi:hypothetical protein